MQDLPPLTLESLPEETDGLYEDLENWDHGHTIDGQSEDQALMEVDAEEG